MKPEVQPHHYSVDGGSTVWRSERIATPGEVFSLVQMAQSWAMHLEQNASPIPGKRSTSRKAAARMNPNIREGREKIIYELLLERNMTDEAAADLLGIPLNSYRPLRNRLVSIDHVRDSGQRLKTESGCDAIAWCAVATPEPKANPIMQHGDLIDRAIDLAGLEVGP